MRMLDLFCGRFGWSKAFAERGWECVGIDLVEPPEVPDGCTFFKTDILNITADSPFMRWDDGSKYFDFICASSPCEQFSVHGMPHFHKNPPYPEMGIKLFNHTRALCEAAGVPYIMENVRPAQEFVGKAVNHCGPFYLWGSAVPPLMAQGITKGANFGSTKKLMAMTREERKAARRLIPAVSSSSKSAHRKALTAGWATIPPELSACVADYAERLLEMRATA
jgi:hypothetical protein